MQPNKIPTAEQRTLPEERKGFILMPPQEIGDLKLHGVITIFSIDLINVQWYWKSIVQVSS